MKITAHTVIDVMPREVLGAFTETRHTVRWWDGAQTAADLRTGGMVSWQWRSGEGLYRFITQGRVAAYEAGLYLQLEEVYHYDYRQPGVAGPAQLLIECTPQAGATFLQLVHESAIWDDPQHAAYAEAVKDGWKRVLESLKPYLENIRPRA